MLKSPPTNAGDVGSILGLEDPLEWEMTSHSSILAREIPQRDEPGRLQSTGSQRVGHDLATKQQQHTKVHKQMHRNDTSDSPTAAEAHGKFTCVYTKLLL